MSDAPETIWVNINDSEDGCCPVEDEHLGDGRFYDPDTATEYRRADLPPTLSAAMELPEVRALTHAVASQLTYMDMCGDHGDLYNRLKAALAAIKEPSHDPRTDRRA